MNWFLSRITFLIFFVLIVPSLLFLYSCDNNGSDHVLRLALDHPVRSFDPGKIFSGAGLEVVANICEPLFEYDYLARPYKLVPLVAEGLPKISSDGKRYQIKIKKQIFYHKDLSLGEHPRELQAKDFAFAIKRVLDPKLKSPGLSFYSNISSISSPSSHLLEIVLKKPQPHFIYHLAMHFSCPIPSEFFNFYNRNLSSKLIGTGPFRLSSFDKEKSIIRLQRFSAYKSSVYPQDGDRYAHLNKLLKDAGEDLPLVGSIEYRHIDSLDERVERFFKDELDMISVSGKILQRALSSDDVFLKKMKESNVNIKYFPSVTNRWLGFNMNHPILGKNLALRKAISHAIDREAYIKEVTGQTGLEANSIFTPGVFGYDPSTNFPNKFDLDLAKQFMKQAGYGSKKLKLTYSTRSNADDGKKEAAFLAKSLKPLNIDLDINFLSFQEFLKKGRAGELDFFTDNWIYDYPEPSNMLQLLYSSNSPGVNKSAFKNRQYDKLYLDILNEKNLELKKRKMRKMEKIVYEKLPWIMLSYERRYILSHNRIQNLRFSSFIKNYLKYINIK